MRPSQSRAGGRERGERGPTGAAVALAFSEVPLTGPLEEVARACAAAVRALTGGAALVRVPTGPVPLEAGDRQEGMVPLLRFPAPGGEGEVWVSPEAGRLAPEARDALVRQMGRVWEVQRQRAEGAAEVDQLRFHLAALQQVARTLAVVRGMGETQHLVLDSVREVFFTWWAALYRADGDRYTCRAVRALRGAEETGPIPSEAVLAVVTFGGAPVLPTGDADIRRHLPPATAVLAPLEVGEGEGGLLVLGERMTGAAYQPHDLALLRALADASAIALRNAELHDRLRAQATIDPLTGCHNRRGFDELLTLEIARSRRYRRPLALVLLDVDHFKQINDEYGHEVGDLTLHWLGGAVRGAFRSTDVACRYGGEEFAVLFPETTKEEGVHLANRLRLLLEMQPEGDLPRTLTASFGVAGYPEDGTDPAALLRAADRALYQAKAAGRNRVTSA